MALAVETSKWAQTLWRSHLAHSQAARTLVAAGTKRQKDFAEMADDIHGLLYLRTAPPALPTAPRWATDLLEQAQALPEWQVLRTRCLQSGFQAGVATQHLLQTILDVTPQQRDTSPKHTRHQNQAQGEQPDPGDTRRALRQALREAGKAVDEADATMEGLTEALGIGAGSEPGQEQSLVELEQVRTLWETVGQHHLLKLIAQMAGRLVRLAHSTKRSKGQSRVGAIRGLTVGGDLPRILPQEVAGLRGGRLARLQTLGKIAQRKALQYDLKGDVPEARGPMLVLLDKSSSMDSPLQRLLWSKAVALALLTICREERRTWGCLTFDGAVHKEVVVENGVVTDQDALMALLLEGASGGTRFAPPVSRALALLAERPALKKADILLVTDGLPQDRNKPVWAETLEALNVQKAQNGLSLYAVGIGGDAQVDLLRTFATATFQVKSDPQADDTTMAPILEAIA